MLIGAVVYQMNPLFKSRVSGRISTFLYCQDDVNKKSNVFIWFYSTSDLNDVDSVLDYLRSKAPTPILLFRRQKEENSCVEVEARGSGTQIVFGFSPPSGRSSADLEEIISWFKKNKLSAKLA